MDSVKFKDTLLIAEPLYSFLTSISLMMKILIDLNIDLKTPTILVLPTKIYPIITVLMMMILSSLPELLLVDLLIKKLSVDGSGMDFTEMLSIPIQFV